MGGTLLEIPHDDLPVTEKPVSKDAIPRKQSYQVEPIDLVFTSLVESNAETSYLPSIAECAVHLQFLEVLVTLKDKVEKWGHSRAIETEEAWDLFVRLAALRFMTWAQDAELLDVATLPPLDILMVWHALMLNPLPYAQFEKVVLRGRISKGIDWASLHQAIDRNTCTFDLSAADREKALSSSLHPNLLELLDAEEATMKTLIGLRASPDRHQSSSFSFDLVAAVHRQFKFAEKMSRYNWLHSPFAPATLGRAIDRYEKFFALIAAYPGKMLSPTLDIDLVWHTHQLSPHAYRKYSQRETGGRFINHDDTIDDNRLPLLRDDAQRLFRLQYDAEYFLCHCWFCEADRSGCLSSYMQTGDGSDLRLGVQKCIESERIRRQRAMLPVMMEWAHPCEGWAEHGESHGPKPQPKPSGCGGCSGNCGGGCGGD